MASSSFMDASVTDPKKAPNIFVFKANDIDGNLVDLAKYKDHVCIVVNVASKWGKTRVNYEQLTQMYKKYSDESAGGLRILAFPCNQFGGQEPGSAQDIKDFVAKFDVKFDMFEKIDVNGKNEHPLFTYLKHEQSGFMINAIKWNFSKFVINKEGKPVARFSPTDDPIPKVEEKVKELF